MKVMRVVFAALVAAAVGLVPVGAEEGETSYAETILVGEDPAGDWGGGGQAGSLGDALGQDLLEAHIGMPDADTVEFVITVTNLPPFGGWPEFTRYTWDMLVDGEFVELDGKFTNYSRGICDPTSGQCPPPRDPGISPFFIRGDCAVGEGNVTTCREIGVVEASFDAGAGTITIPVPTELIGAEACSMIEEGPNIFGGSISATPAAFVTSSAMPLDTMFVDEPFQIPSGDPDVDCE